MILCAPSARGCFNKHYSNKAKLLMVHINAPATHQLTTYSSTCKYLLHPACSLYSQLSSQTYTSANLHNHSPFVSEFQKDEMKSERSMQASLFMWVMVTGFLFQNLVIPVMSIRFEDQKNYYSPDPHSGSPPTGSHRSPPHGTTPPSHETPTPPSHGTYNPTPSPPSNCGNPPHEPSTPSTPSTPSNPPSDGGGYYSPPTHGGGSPPDIITPSPPSITPSPPSIIPGTPTIPTPPFDPHSPFPGTCTYWSSHPGLIWGLLGWWGTLGGIGVPSVPGFGSSTSLLQALSNTRTDGFGALYREGTASLLNSMANHRFPFTTNQVRDSFVAALHSNRAAAAQARLFKLANEGHFKPRA